ncbi:hypothetical protein HK405_013946, partial [Cladochytrium tenue]
NEFLAYADYLVRLNDLIQKNQGSNESIYSFSLDAGTGSDGDDYDYEDLCLIWNRGCRFASEV